MFLYKALKHRDEEEDIQVHTQWLGVAGQAVGWAVCLHVSLKPPVVLGSVEPGALWMGLSAPEMGAFVGIDEMIEI